MTVVRDTPPWKSTSPEQAQQVRDALALVGAADLADRPIGALSGGQLQRVMIARALAPRPRVLLLDEPTVGIDVVGQQQFAELMRRISAELKLTVVIVSHDLRTIAAGCDRVACLGRTLHFHDAPGGLTPAVLAELFRHDVAAIFGGSDRAWHIDAHKAEACPHPEHRHPHAHAGPCTDEHTHDPVPLGVRAPSRTTGPDRSGTGGAAAEDAR
jgi:ABC-type Mn2+/Zn2+ transport system ATPase subunit